MLLFDAVNMAQSEEPVTIKKYANRRLYNTGTSTYVTLEDLATMVKAGSNFVVYDAKTGEDITRSVLAQIIFEQENKEGQSLLPITFLRQLIRFYGDSMQMLVPRYLEVSIDTLVREQEKMRTQMAQAFGVGGFGPLEEQVRRNMEMFERTFAMFAPRSRAAKARPAEADKRPATRALRGPPTAARSTISSGRWKTCRSGSTGWAARKAPTKSRARNSGPARARLRYAPRARGARDLPRPLRRREPDQRPLQIVAAPFGQHRGRRLVLHPFGDRLETEPPPQIDQRVDEGAVVLRLHEVLHEGAIDLDEVDAELAQIAERGVAGAEIVDGDAAAQILDAGHEAAGLVDILDRRRLGDLDREPLRHARMRAQHRAERRPTNPDRRSRRPRR